MRAMKQIALITALALAGCTTTPAGLAKTGIKETIPSEKPAKEFALCVAERVPGATLRDDGERYWVLVDVWGVPRFRFDFIPSETGSIAEMRSTAVGKSGVKDIRRCA